MKRVIIKKINKEDEEHSIPMNTKIYTEDTTKHNNEILYHLKELNNKCDMLFHLIKEKDKIIDFRERNLSQSICSVH